MDASVVEQGDLIHTTTHYELPNYTVGSIDTLVSSYEHKLSADVQEAFQFTLGVGYRHCIRDRWVIGADAAVVVPTYGSSEITTTVGEFGLSIGLAIGRSGLGAVPQDR